MNTNEHEKNASQTSPMMLMILCRHDIMIAEYQDGLRLLGGFHPLRGVKIMSCESLKSKSIAAGGYWRISSASRGFRFIV
jgi:hypothetical protein